jgi:hypothetical protein
MNQDQGLGILRALLPAALAYVVGKGWVPAGSAGDIGAAVVAIATAFWSYTSHTDSAKIAAASALPDVAKIIVAPTASPGSAAAMAAKDTDQPKVQKAI